MKQSVVIFLSLFMVLSGRAQIDVGGIVKRKLEDRATREIEEGTDKVMDETEEGVKGSGKNKKGKDGKSPGKEEGGDAESTAPAESAASKATLKTYGKFDFIPGEKIIVEDDFSQVTVGDFPAEWNTNSGGEVVTIDGVEGHWLMLSKEGVYIPDYITDMPENFTMQFDVICNPDFNYYSSALNFTFVPTDQRQKLGEFARFSHPAHAVRVSMHPENAGGSQGTIGIETWDGSGAELVNNNVITAQFDEDTSPHVRVSVWRQKQRLRVYINEEKVLDIPRAFDAVAKYNTFIVSNGGMHHDTDHYLLGDLRFAVGSPDTRSKLITEGKLVTRGILFDSGSDKIKPESYGTLKDIATVLKENATVKVKIIGHTDSDGEDAANIELSKKRAAAVSKALTDEFAIDASRMETDGKGESQPSDKNDTATGKANNRRVEFVKL